METKNQEMAVSFYSSSVCPGVRLEVTLQYLAGEIFRNIQSNFGAMSGKFYRSVWRVMDSINKNLYKKRVLSDVNNLRQRETEFDGKSRLGAIKGAVGALDGCLIWQKNPGVSVDNLSRYCCARKEKLASLLMEICGAKRSFLWIDIGFTPTTHDSLAQNCLGLKHYVRGEELKRHLFPLADSAFICTQKRHKWRARR